MRACGSSKSQPIFWCEYGGEPCSLSSGHIACEAHKKRHILLHLPIRSAPTSAPVLGSGLLRPCAQHSGGTYAEVSENITGATGGTWLLLLMVLVLVCQM